MRAATDFGSILGGVLMVGLGLLFTLGSCWWAVVLLRMRGRATGTIVGMQPGPLCEALPVVAFTSSQGAAIRFTGATRIGRVAGPRIGDTVPVRYDLADPEQARIATVRGSFAGPAIGLLTGVALLGLVVVAAHDQRARGAARAHTPIYRRAVYLPLQLWATELGACTGGACTARKVARTLRAYDRAHAVAMRSGEVSAAVETEIALLESSLVDVRFNRREIGPSVRPRVVALLGQILGELSADGCASACVSGFRDPHGS